jgi:hypothetical protein
MGLLRHLWNRNYCTSLLIIRRARGAPRKKSWGRHSPFLFYIRIVVRIVPTGLGFTVVGGAEDGRTFTWIIGNMIWICWMTILTLPYFNFFNEEFNGTLQPQATKQAGARALPTTVLHYLLQNVPYLLQHVPYLLL